MSILIKRAQILGRGSEQSNGASIGDILISGNRIARIDQDIDARSADRVISGENHLAMPGLINAHLHSFAGFQRGRYDNLPLELWMLYAYPLSGLAPMSEDLVHLRTLVVGLESLKTGVTAILDDVLEMPGQSLASLAAVFRAYDELGIRASCSGHVLDRNLFETLPFAREVFPPEVLTELKRIPTMDCDRYLEFSKEAVSRWHMPEGRLRYVVSPSGPQRCTTDLLQASHDFATRQDLIFHLHVLETKSQFLTGEQHYGCSLLEYMDRIGVLDRQCTLAHLIWVTDDDIHRMAAADCCVVHNPTSNLRTGAGIAPYRRLAAAGLPIALGTDGIASNGSARLFDVMRLAALLHKVTSPFYESWPSADEILRAATRGGARALHQEEEIGSLEVGKLADIVLLDTTTFNFTPQGDLQNQLVYSENGTSVTTVIVDGEIVVENGKSTRVDEAAVMGEFRAKIGEFLRRYRLAEEANEELVPYLAAMHRMCASENISLNRYGSSRENW